MKQNNTLTRRRFQIVRSLLPGLFLLLAIGLIGCHNAEVGEQSQKNIRELAVAILMSAQDNDEVLPSMSDAPSVKRALYRYVHTKDPYVYVSPDTGEPYQPNPALSGHKLSSISSPGTFVSFYEATAASDGKRAVAYLNGRAARLSASEWTSAKQASGIP